MCGVCGVYSFSPRFAVDTRLVEAMRRPLSHRGPDGVGLHVVENSIGTIGLGHTRLAILDLSDHGLQPMHSDDGRLSIVYNGEIFNFKELRTELIEQHGHNFRSDTDTEVILHAFQEWGLENSLNRFRGMYAFAIYDNSDKSVTLVRDPLGVKPMYYIADENYFAFASEIKSILTLPWMDRSIDDASLYHYLTFANAPAPRTFFSRILKLEAGAWLRIDGKRQVRHGRYWDPSRYLGAQNNLSEGECIEELRHLLRQSVARRMVSDVPFGVFLSGGLDSSLNVALMAEQLDHPVETFSIGIKGDATNEFEYARQVSQLFGTNHHERMIDDDDFLSALPTIAYHQDEPLADPVCVPIYYLSELARQSGVPVIQVGEGSDEIFAGYKVYKQFAGWWQDLFRAYQFSPGPLRRAISTLTRGRLAPQWEDVLRRAARNEPFFIGNAVAFWDSEKEALLKGGKAEVSSGALIRTLMPQLTNGSTLSSITGVELHNRLPELLLMRVDKMAMAHSVETRVPFLDEDLVQFALGLPSRLKIGNGQTKFILKKAAEGILPNEIIYRKKMGFCGSATNMLSDRIANYAREVVLDSPLITERFNVARVERIFEMHQTQKRFASFKIWNLMNLALWHEAVVKNPV